MSEQVTVVIQCSERVTYHKVLKMDRAEFERLDSSLDSQDRTQARKATSEIISLINRNNDYLDSDDEEIEQFGVMP